MTVSVQTIKQINRDIYAKQGKKTPFTDKLNIRYIFGMKLRNFRHEKGYGLKELAALTGLSVSYINEIEKGKKYPKAEKIMNLADGLGGGYDDLVSISMTGRLGKLRNCFYLQLY